MPNGVFYGDSATTFAAITDGLSNTMVYGERVVGDAHDRGRQPDRRRLLRSPVAHDNVADQAIAALPRR